MCGIAGVIKYDGNSVSREHLAILRERLKHRGPDGDKTWVSPDECCGFVHTRLAILDVEARSDQPMITSDKNYTIVFNGEIYNFLEVRDELKALGHEFHTESDTEVLLQGWRMWGRDLLDRLNGMFAFAIRDNQSKQLFLVRDRFGVKPLLYSHTSAYFAFASEMQALAALPFVSKDIDRQVATRLLFDPMSIEGSDRTLLRAIRRLPAGHLAILDGTTLTLQRWWRTTDHLALPPNNMKIAAERFRDLFLDSIRLRMRSDVRIGSCLSGGFDSSAVVCGMAKISGDIIADHQRQSDDWRHSFTASFPSLALDETPDALISAAFAGAIPHLLDFSRDEGPADAEAAMEALDEIYFTLPTAVWKTYRAVREQGVRVSLDGHGADELLGAYFPGQAGIGFIIRQALNVGGPGKKLFGKVSITDLARLVVHTIQGHQFLRVFHPPPRIPIAAMEDPLPRNWGALNRRLYGMVHSTILPTILRNFDRLSMAHGIEVRMPFLDWRLVVFAMSLPDQMKMGKGVTKLIAREAMAGLMPEKIRVATRKVGFNSQMPQWLNQTLGSWALKIIERDGHPFFDEIVNRNRLANRIRNLNKKKSWDWKSAERIWIYVHLKWYLDRLSASSPPHS